MPWPARLFALVRHGVQPVDCAGLPVWPLAWALSQQLEEADMMPFPSASPQRLALAMRRRHRRPPGPHSLEHCLHQSARALHPVQRMAWLTVLVEGHGVRAIEPLLKSLGVALNRPSPFLELGEALAWALGQMGRDILLSIGDRFKDAPFLVREHYCQALWYLGAGARGCQSWLRHQQSEWAEAVLYRLEGLGSPALIERRRVPIWLDEHSVEQLADLAFSQEPGDRLYALRALDGWGPARFQAVRLVQATLADLDDEVKLQAWRTLLSLGEVPTATDVSRALRSQHSQLIQLASDHCDLLLGSQPPLDSLEEAMNAGDEARTELSLARLQARPFPSERLRRFLALLPRLSSEQQRSSSEWLVKGEWWAEDWARIVELQPTNAWLLEAVCRRPNALVQLYIQPPLRQRLISRLEALLREPEPLARAAARLLEELQGACLNWERLESLIPERRRQALDWVLKSGELPDQLLQPLLDGRFISPDSLHLVVELTPESELYHRLERMFAKSPSQHRSQFLDIMMVLPESGWPLLMSWLEKPALAEAALNLLETRLFFADARSWLSGEGTPILRPAAPAAVVSRWQWQVAEKVCQISFPDHFHWACELCEADSRPAMLALEFLHEHYSVKERPKVLEVTVHCLSHPSRTVRVDAIRHLRLSAPLPEAIIDQILALTPDPEVLVERARVVLLSELSYLRPDQKEKVLTLSQGLPPVE